MTDIEHLSKMENCVNLLVFQLTLSSFVQKQIVFLSILAQHRYNFCILRTHPITVNQTLALKSHKEINLTRVLQKSYKCLNKTKQSS